MRIALDAMGGDKAPAAPVEGALASVREDPATEVVLVGDPAVLERELAARGRRPPGIAVVASDGVVGMDEEPVRAMKAKPRNSARVAAECLAKGEADGVVNLGHTGAAVAAATLFCPRIPGVSRLGIAVPFPRREGNTVVVDCGGLVDARAEHLHAYAIMARHYARVAFGKAEPRIGILSVGEEEHKGNRLVRETWELFKAHPVPGFVGNVEGRDAFGGAEVDVIVCDGFVGNVMLKAVEGLAEMMIGMVKDALPANPGIAPLLKTMVARLDYAEYGGAPLLGVRGPYVIGHGRSDARAVRNAIRVARDLAAGQVHARVAEEIAASGLGGTNA
jgi:glycerol-3-phosphate acyltransferase PlsX